VDLSGPTATRLRALGRRLRVLPPLVRAYRAVVGVRYEDRFDRALQGAVRRGDVVWDVGANVGLYTAKFASAIGADGRVVAFEPSPRNARILEQRFAGARTVTIAAVALSDRNGVAPFYENDDETSVTDSLVPRAAGIAAHSVVVRRGDEYLGQYPPNVIKVDVEGFEPEVLDGLHATLADTRLRAVFIEVHFGILAERGRADAPAGIAALLRRAGFAVAWADPSHLSAVRPSAA